jgi:hypothetical protein
VPMSDFCRDRDAVVRSAGAAACDAFLLAQPLAGCSSDQALGARVLVVFRYEPTCPANWDEAARRSRALILHTSLITVVEATYGANAGATRGNATQDVASTCNGKPSCEYVVDLGKLRLGDPAFGVKKDFIVVYRCGGAYPKRATVPGEAAGESANLNCP